MKNVPRKPIKWIGSSKKDLSKMPVDVQDVFGHAIDLAQAGGNILMPSRSKVMALGYWKS